VTLFPVVVSAELVEARVLIEVAKIGPKEFLALNNRAKAAAASHTVRGRGTLTQIWTSAEASVSLPDREIVRHARADSR
jgi:hypothetical protein